MLGLYRKLGCYLGIALMITFLAGTEGTRLRGEHVIEMSILVIGCFIVYLGVLKDLEDPLAIDSYLKNK